MERVLKFGKVLQFVLFWGKVKREREREREKDWVLIIDSG